jgi:hypothetical protein
MTAMIRASAIAGVLLFARAAAVLAGGEGSGQLLITSDHIEPGMSFEILGARLDPGATIELSIRGETDTIALGTTSVHQDGSMSFEAVVPESFALGYAHLTGRLSTGTEVTTLVQVGIPPTAPGAESGSEGVDERSIGLVILVVGLAIFAMAVVAFIRGGRAPKQTR